MNTKPVMPIMSSKYLKEMPMAMLNEKQAQSNHGQSLATLASRGGICPAEALAIMDGLKWGSVKVGDQNDRLLRNRVAKYLEDNKTVKECAARIRGLDCKNPRAKDSLFCQQHTHASNRILLFQYVSDDALAQKVQP